MQAPPDAPDLHRSGILLTLAGVTFLLVVTVLESLASSYSVHRNTISDLLALGTRTAWAGEPLLFLAGLAWIAGAYYLYRGTGSRGEMILNILPGAGLLLAVLSPENVNVVVHSVGAVLAFVPGPLAAILSYRRIESAFRYFALALGVRSLASVGIEFGAYSTPLVQATLGGGGWERAIVYPLLIWLIGYGSYLLAPAARVVDERTPIPPAMSPESGRGVRDPT